MQDLIVDFLISLAQSHPYLLLASAFIGFIWVARSVVHKARLFTQHLTKEVHEFRVEIHEWADDLRKLWRAFKLHPKTPDVKEAPDGNHEKVLARLP